MMLRDSLEGQAELLLTYDGLVGKYQDSLKVIADFVGQTIDVDFRPNPREFTITIFDTTEIRTGDSFLTNVLQIAGGVAAGFVISEIKK